jgi:hypothetical protein
MSRISSRFGIRHHPVWRFTRLHSGVDFAARTRHAKVYGLLEPLRIVGGTFSAPVAKRVACSSSYPFDICRGRTVTMSGKRVIRTTPRQSSRKNGAEAFVTVQMSRPVRL